MKVISISKYNDLLIVVKLILTLSHDQASVEHGFSLNANIMKTNMSPKSLTAKRIIKDHMLANKLNPHTIEITKPIVQADRNLKSILRKRRRKNKSLRLK